VIESYFDDCVRGMKKYPDQYFDLAIPDPPYGIKESAHRARSRTKLAKTRCYGTAVWDLEVPGVDYWDELFRVSKHQVVWGGNYFLEYLGPTRCMLIWRKLTTGNFADCELAWTSFDTSVREFTFMWNGMLQGRSMTKGHLAQNRKQYNEERIHPTQKPVELYKWVLKNYAKPGDKILDTHSGSLSLGIACYRMGFDLVAFENNRQHYDDAIKRLNNEYLKTELHLEGEITKTNDQYIKQKLF